MMNQTIDKLLSMNLSGMADSIREQAAAPRHHDALSFEERVSMMVEREYSRRADAQHQRRRKSARLKADAALENVDFSLPRNLNRSKFLTYAEGTWLRDKMNLIITGPTGVGKSFLAGALADKACRDGMNALVTKSHDLVSTLMIARADGSFEALRKKLAKLHLLVIDEWMRDPLPHAQARELLDLVDERYKAGSILLVSQVPVAEWHPRFEDASLGDALLDRLVHNAYRLELQGDSMRKRLAKKD